MSAPWLRPHGLCLSRITALRRLPVAHASTYMRRLYSNEVSEEEREQKLLEMQIKNLNSDPSKTDVQKHRNTIRLFYNLEAIKTKRNVGIQLSRLREVLDRYLPVTWKNGDYDAMMKMLYESREPLHAMDSALRDANAARWRALAPNIFAPWEDDISHALRVRLFIRTMFGIGATFFLARASVRYYLVVGKMFM